MAGRDPCCCAICVTCVVRLGVCHVATLMAEQMWAACRPCLPCAGQCACHSFLAAVWSAAGPCPWQVLGMEHVLRCAAWQVLPCWLCWMLDAGCLPVTCAYQCIV